MTMTNRRTLLVGAAGLAALGATGCNTSKPKAGVNNAKGLEIPTYMAPPKVEGAIISSVPGVPPGYTKLPADLVQTVKQAPGDGSAITEFKITWDAPCPPLSENKFWQAYNKTLNVDYKPTIVDAGSYDAKLATLLAGNSLPDIVQLLPNAQATKALRDGAFADLTPMLGGDKIKDWPNLATIASDQWKACAFGGKLMGFPIDLPAFNNEFRYRADWAAKNGYPEAPKTPAEFKEVMASMSKMGVAGRYGLGDAPGTAGEVAKAMFRVPNNWREEGGKLTNAIETDEYEQALTYLAELWKAGCFNPNALALSQDIGRLLSMIPAGQVGISLIAAANWYQAGVYKTALDKEPGSWKVFVPQAADGKGDGVFNRSNQVFARVSISAAAAKDEKRLRMLLDFCNYMRAPLGSIENYFLFHGKEGDYFTRSGGGEPTPVTGTNWSADSMQLVYGLPPVTFNFPAAAEAISVNERYVKSSVVDPTAGLYSQTAVDKAASLGQLAQTYINQMIIGRRPLADLAKYREEWRKRGGDAMRSEFEKGLQGG